MVKISSNRYGFLFEQKRDDCWCQKEEWIRVTPVISLYFLFGGCDDYRNEWNGITCERCNKSKEQKCTRKDYYNQHFMVEDGIGHDWVLICTVFEFRCVLQCKRAV